MKSSEYVNYLAVHFYRHEGNNTGSIDLHKVFQSAEKQGLISSHELLEIEYCMSGQKSHN